MTKCIVLGQEPAEVKKKPIEFLKKISADGIPSTQIMCKPNEYKNIELIAKSYSDELGDLMYAFDSDRDLGSIYFGKWNDGVAE